MNKQSWVDTQQPISSIYQFPGTHTQFIILRNTSKVLLLFPSFLDTMKLCQSYISLSEKVFFFAKYFCCAKFLFIIFGNHDITTQYIWFSFEHHWNHNLGGNWKMEWNGDRMGVPFFLLDVSQFGKDSSIKDEQLNLASWIS